MNSDKLIVVLMTVCAITILLAVSNIIENNATLKTNLHWVNDCTKIGKHVVGNQVFICAPEKSSINEEKK